jgi:hypothetical protein
MINPISGVAPQTVQEPAPAALPAKPQPTTLPQDTVTLNYPDTQQPAGAANREASSF